MADGHTWYEGENNSWICKEICDDPEKLVVMKINSRTGEIRYDKYIPNPHHNKESHSHDWNSVTSKSDHHSEYTKSNVKNKLY